MSRDTSNPSIDGRVDPSLSISARLWAIRFFGQVLLIPSLILLSFIVWLVWSRSFVAISILVSAVILFFSTIGVLRDGLDDDECKRLLTLQRAKLRTLLWSMDMGKTVSFRASEKLDDFLEEEAERRLMTKSGVAQMFVAERYHQLQEDQEEQEVSTVDKTDAEEEDSSAGDLNYRK